MFSGLFLLVSIYVLLHNLAILPIYLSRIKMYDTFQKIFSYDVADPMFLTLSQGKLFQLLKINLVMPLLHIYIFISDKLYWQNSWYMHLTHTIFMYPAKPLPWLFFLRTCVFVVVQLTKRQVDFVKSCVGQEKNKLERDRNSACMSSTITFLSICKKKPITYEH